ncbi:MAG: phosphoenolpyruvate mutase [Pseudomonadota bacterium]|nr:phosphoenolpyruvate mutase [Pseudomonadota bacterium]
MSQENNLPRTARFKQLLQSSELEFLCEAHNGISAKIAEEAGFKALWAGGLCMSAQFGVRDSNEASWTQVLEMLEFMADATTTPILLDGDTGYGNFNNVRRLVRKLEQRSVAAVCIEDKLYPKTNSFIDGNKQELADIDEFCSRIKAGKDAQQDDDFSIITRVEAFIAGWGLDEALKRAEAYDAAGSDGILIHSALSHPKEVLDFKKEWADRSPVLIVPTKYYSTPTDVYRDAGFSLVIWANHLLRAGIVAMRNAAEMLADNQSLIGIEDSIAPVKEIFRLQGASELQAAEDLYLPHREASERAIVLAASRGSALGELTAEIPKTMLGIQGRPILGHIVAAYNAVGIKKISVVRGYAAEKINLSGLEYIDNDDYEDTGELLSLQCALKSNPDDESDLYISFGDVIFKRFILDSMSELEEEVVIAVDTSWQESVNRGRAADYVSCSEAHTRHSFNHQVSLNVAGEDLPPEDIHGEWMGIMRVASRSMPILRSITEEILSDQSNREAKLHHLLSEIVQRNISVRVIYTTGHWLDIDSLEDVVAAGSFK